MSERRPAVPRTSRMIAVLAVSTLVSTGLAVGAPPASAAPTTSTAAAPASTTKAHAVSAGRYLVTFADEPAASYEGTVAGYPRTRPNAGQKLNPTRAEVVKWRARLVSVHDRALQAVGATKLADYSVATNGVAVQLTAAQAKKLAATAGVVGMEKDVLKTIDTTDSPAFLGLSDPGGLWSKTVGGQVNAGKGVIVGVIDTGIWPESKSFAGAELKRDKAGQPVAATGLRGTWFGACVQGELFTSQTCNDKLIGARYYVAGFGRQNVALEDYFSPRDGSGHGSHTTSTAAGNKVPGVTIDGFPMGTASGMAPGARVAAYKVCWEAKPGASGGCFNSDSVSAIDDAVADGVDVLNYSVGGSSESSPLDVVEQAFRRASNVGIFVANSAGNSGPGAGTLDHPSPWLTTVAASTFRSSQKAAELGNGARYVGASITPGLPNQTPLVSSTTVGLAGKTATQVRLCYPGTLDPAKVTGKVVQCDRGTIARIDKSFEVKRAGGVGMILTNTGPNSLNSDFHPVPTVHVTDTARTAILAYLAGPGPHTAAIVALSSTESPPATPEVADFSSRGPSSTTSGDILKPDLAAPGVDVLAAVAPPSNHGRSYDFYSGTSMSSPHVAGLGALIKAQHPTWRPSMVKSALMTTARDHATSADPFAQGAGFVRPNLANDPGLVFDAVANDYRSYMVGLGVRFAAPFNTLPPLDGSELNQASIASGSLAGRQTVTRTVTSVSSASEDYTVTAAVPGMSIVTSPSSFTLAPGAKQVLSITMTRDTAALGTYAKGTMTLGSSAHTVRIPVAVRPVAVAAPAELAGTGTSGSTTFDVTPGFTGTLDTTVSGLVGATPVADVVVNGAFAPVASASTKAYTLVVPAGTKLARFDVDAVSALDDLDLFIYKDGKEIDLSASAAGDEQVTLTNPVAGTYIAYVNGYDTAGGGGRYAFTQWAVGDVDALNLTVTDNVPATIAEPVTLTATWTGLEATKRYLGFVGYTLGDERTVVTIG